MLGNRVPDDDPAMYGVSTGRWALGERRPCWRRMVSKIIKTPKELDRIADVVLAYRPKPKSKAAKKRVRKAKKEAKL